MRLAKKYNANRLYEYALFAYSIHYVVDEEAHMVAVLSIEDQHRDPQARFPHLAGR